MPIYTTLIAPVFIIPEAKRSGTPPSAAFFTKVSLFPRLCTHHPCPLSTG